MLLSENQTNEEFLSFYHPIFIHLSLEQSSQTGVKRGINGIRNKIYHPWTITPYTNYSILWNIFQSLLDKMSKFCEPRTIIV